MKLFNTMVITLLLCLIQNNYAASSWSYPGCDAVTDADFTQEVLVGKTAITKPKLIDATLNEPIELDLASDGAGGVDVYFVERKGTLKMYDASANKVLEIGKVAVNSAKDCGFDGIVLAPDFKTSGWIYLFYTPDISSLNDQVYGIYRYTIKNNSLDKSTKKTIWEDAVRYATPWHTGGSMQFDHYGDLWVACGKNAHDDPRSINESDKWHSCEYSSSYFGNARGGVIRIHPITFPDNETPKWGIGRTYTIPRGNLADYYNLKYKKEGKPDRAADFADPKMVMPELYVKGLRNPWTMNIEPVRRWLAWGENGINRSRSYNTEEHNFTTIPGFFGFPYFAGSLEAAECPSNCAGGYNISAKMNTPRVVDPAAPVNNSKWNDALKNLPPAIPAIHPYGRNSAMGGPIYRYDGDLDSDVKFPPHFNHLWLMYDFNRGDKKYAQDVGVTKMARVDVEKVKITESKDWFLSKGQNLYGPLDIEVGPDGAFYVVNYAGWFGTDPRQNISRIKYTGDCRPSQPKLEEKVNPNVYYPPAGYGCLTKGNPNYDADAFAHDERACDGVGVDGGNVSVSSIGASLKGNLVSITDAGKHSVVVRSVSGHQIESFNGTGSAQYSLDHLKQSGVYFITMSTSNGSLVRKFASY